MFNILGGEKFFVVTFVNYDGIAAFFAMQAASSVLHLFHQRTSLKPCSCGAPH
jgi:hypothetical protein